MEEASQITRSFWYRTTAHNLRFLQIFTKKEKIFLATTAVSVLSLLALSSYFTGLVVIAGIFLLVGALGWGFYWRKVCKDRLIKLYLLLKETSDIYLWVETWDLKEKYLYSNPDYYWAEGKELVRVYDYINTYKNSSITEELKLASKHRKEETLETDALPIPFRPFDIGLGTVTSIDLARTQEQSAAERLFTSLRKNWNEVVKLGIYVVIIIALIVGIIALLGT